MDSIYDNIENRKYYNDADWSDREAWKKKDKELEDLFYRDLCEWSGVNPDSPQSWKIWEKTCNDNTNCGPGYFAGKFKDLVEFINDLRRLDEVSKGDES